MTVFTFNRLRLAAQTALMGSLALLSLNATASHAEAAATAAEAPADTLPEIVVTAQKRETRLQKTPISISVMNKDDFSNRHAQSLADLGDGAIPSLRVAPFFSRSSALTIGMRGVGSMGDANQPSRDQGVGVYVDGVYMGRAQGLGMALLDLERVEVLKGPQGTLFGRNTEGGAISIVTKKPTGVYGMNTTFGLSNFNGYKLESHLNLPEMHNVSVKADLVLSKRDGTVKNPLDGAPDFNAYDKGGVRLEALWRASDSVSVDYALDASRDASTPYYVQLLSKGSLPLAPLTPAQPDRAKSALIGVPMQHSVGNTSGHTLVIDWKLSDGLKLKSISSYRKLTQSQFDNGSTALSVFAPNGNFSRYSLANFDQSQYSQEIQLIGDSAQFHYVGGAFFYHESVADDAWAPNTLQWNATGTGYTILPAPVNATPFPDRASTAKTDSAGLFGQLTWTPDAFDGKAHLTIGARYTEDKKQGELLKVNGAIPVVNGVAAIQHLDAKWDRIDPMVTLAYDVTDDINLYAKWSTGYKAGGANSRSLTYRAFGPESVEAREIGLKSEWFDRSLRFNLAAYDSDYKDTQIDFNAVIPGNTRGTLETTNAAGTAKLKGVEADITYRPFRGLILGATYATNSTHLPKAPNPFVTGNPLVAVYPLYAPKNAYSVTVDYSRPVGSALFKAHLDANGASGQNTSSADPTRSDNSLIVNGRLALANIALPGQNTALQLSLWSRNLTNEKHVFMRNFNAALGTYGIYNEPRTYGIEANISF